MKTCFEHLAKQKSDTVSIIRHHYYFVLGRLNIIDKYISIKHPFDEELIDILSITENQIPHQPKRQKLKSIDDKNKQTTLLKRELEQAMQLNVPDDDLFSYLANRFNTSEGVIRAEFVQIKTQEYKEMSFTVILKHPDVSH